MPIIARQLPFVDQDIGTGVAPNCCAVAAALVLRAEPANRIHMSSDCSMLRFCTCCWSYERFNWFCLLFQLMGKNLRTLNQDVAACTLKQRHHKLYFDMWEAVATGQIHCNEAACYSDNWRILRYASLLLTTLKQSTKHCRKERTFPSYCPTFLPALSAGGSAHAISHRTKSFSVRS